ncbi:hypothetical protein E2C01_072325 [Portunus trituberculatus]|uniref:Uncharacterized protein n=1 Tax=Portunus trituberculatus TaxID=210409 RepID=A0A5B7I7E9_PORTR|nr:hypothetical protein [Portunus trituberculatus]
MRVAVVFHKPTAASCYHCQSECLAKAYPMPQHVYYYITATLNQQNRNLPSVNLLSHERGTTAKFNKKCDNKKRPTEVPVPKKYKGKGTPWLV